MDGPVLVGTDGSETSMKAVAEAVRLAAAFGRPLHIVTAFKPQSAQAAGLPAEFGPGPSAISAAESALADAASRARAAGVKPECHLQRGDPAEVLLDMAEEIEASILVVGNKGIGSAKRFLLGNVPSKVVHHAPCSTFVVQTTSDRLRS